MMKATSDGSSNTEYDVIVVGSGNGACALLKECLDNAPTDEDYKILVLEQGQNFFYTSDVTHENGWSRSYSTGKIFKLHNTSNRKGRAIISGRAVTMGGGGSINYTMIHESSAWLSKNIGQSEDFWDKMKIDVGKGLKRKSPFDTRSEDFIKIIEEKATLLKKNPFQAPNEDDNFASNIPSLNDKWNEYPEGAEGKQMYIFPTQFNKFGQRTNSGVSLVDWGDKRIDLNCLREVKGLNMVEGTCKSVSVKNTETGKDEEFSVKADGKVILCSGSQSPRLLMRSKEVTNKYIGKYVKDHICMPLAIYIVAEKRDDKLAKLIGPKNNYESIFATTAVKTGDGDEREVCTLDFFSGDIDRLIFFVSHFYLAYIPFNGFKRLLSKYPYLFTLLSNGIRVLLKAVVFILQLFVGFKDVLTFQGWGASKIKITTTLIKFNTFADGQYEEEDEAITLGFFEDKRDSIVAETAIKESIPFLETLGKKPNFLIRKIFSLITKIPYDESQVLRYVRHFSSRTLVSEQHLAGGCLFGKVIDSGVDDPSATGKVFDTTNLHVADLSTVPLPRVSTSMTAYVIGHYVGSQLFGPKEEKKKND